MSTKYKKSDYKKSVLGVGVFILSWFAERVLDSWGIFNKITHAIDSSNFSFLNNTITITYWKVPIILALFFFLYFIVIKVSNSSREKKEIKIRNHFIKNHEFMSIPENDSVIFRTDIEFRNSKVILKSVHPYCTLHNINYKMTLSSNGHLYDCPNSPCQNGFVNVIIKQNVLNNLQSVLENDWNRIKKNEVFLEKNF